jgi:site-specific recombinase XerD
MATDNPFGSGYCTNALTLAAVQKELLRHANISTTLNIYTQAVAKSLREASSKAVKALLPEEGKE